MLAEFHGVTQLFNPLKLAFGGLATALFISTSARELFAGRKTGDSEVILRSCKQTEASEILLPI